VSQYDSNASLFLICNKWCLNEQFTLMLIQADCVMSYMMKLNAVIIASGGLYVYYWIFTIECVCVCVVTTDVSSVLTIVCV
jgi:hypothetical protein